MLAGLLSSEVVGSLSLGGALLCGTVCGRRANER